MAARFRPRPTSQASRRRRCASSLRSALRDARRAGRLEPWRDDVRRMIDTDDRFLPLLGRRVAENPAGAFARFEGEPLSFGELDRMSNALAAWMREIGLVSGDVVALMIRNSPIAV